MKRTLAAVLVAMISLPSTGFSAGRAAQAPTGTGSVQGTATNTNGATLPNYSIQLRNLATGQLAGTTTSNAAGAFSFAGLTPGNYVIEVVNQAGAVVGTSAALTVTAGTTITVSVSASAAAAIGGTAAGVGTAAYSAAPTGVSTAVIVGTVATAAGIAGAVAIALNEASPSR